MYKCFTVLISLFTIVVAKADRVYTLVSPREDRAVTSVHIPEEDAYYRVRDMCVLSHVKIKSWD